MRSIKGLYRLLVALSLLLLSGCDFLGTHYEIIGRVDTLKELSQMHAVRQRNSITKANNLNTEALRDVGLSVGAQAGLAFRAQQINEARKNSEKALESVFNFNLLMLPNNVLPPVLIQGEQSLNLADTQTLRIADRTYKIVKQARFVSTPPIWRDYLWMHYNFPEKPAPAFLPKNKEEQAVWRAAVQEGWKKGVFQANAIDAENVAQLKRDYLGIVLYRKLLKQGMVSEPYVARSDLGITGDEETIRIHDQVLRITALPALQTNYHDWRPMITQSES